MDKTLKEMIRDRGFKQLEIAKHLDVSESHVSLLIKGKRRMNLDQAFEIASLMKVSIDDVFEGLQSTKISK